MYLMSGLFPGFFKGLWAEQAETMKEYVHVNVTLSCSFRKRRQVLLLTEDCAGDKEQKEYCF